VDGRFDDADDDGGEVIWLFDADAHTEPAVCTPSGLFERLDRVVGEHGLALVSVRGAVRGVRRRGQICTFELADPAATDATGERAPALVRVVVFPQRLRVIDAALARSGGALVDGVEVTVTGAVRFDPPFGGVRLVAADVDVDRVEATFALDRTRLLAKLAAEGLLSRQAALVVPGRPLRIGLITAAGSAGDTDVSTLLEESGIEWQLLRQPAPMAGPHAAGAVVAAIERLSGAGVDVIVIARGGGGRTELGCWDDRSVVRSIALAPVPVWTAIGHAADVTVADQVANRSCATPSAAAALLIERVRDFERHRRERVVFAEHRQRVALERARASRARVVAIVAVLAALVVVVLALR